jgi:putative SOS response-associated peptidase YedK
MCNLCSLTRNVGAIHHLFWISVNRATRIEPQPAIFPSSINHERMPVLLSEEAELETWLSGNAG